MAVRTVLMSDITMLAAFPSWKFPLGAVQVPQLVTVTVVVLGATKPTAATFTPPVDSVN